MAEKVISGIADACKQNGCALIGGETAEMPGFYPDGEYDLAGFIVGVVDRAKIITGKDVQPGDVLIGLPSTGLHTNGYSLARKLFFEIARYTPESYVNEIKGKVGTELMRTHKSYWPIVRRMLDAEAVTAMAHITGGGITENLPRVLPKGTGAIVEIHSWPVLPIFEHLQKPSATFRRTRCCAPSTWASAWCWWCRRRSSRRRRPSWSAAAKRATPSAASSRARGA